MALGLDRGKEARRHRRALHERLAPLHAPVELPRPRNQTGRLHHRSLRRLRRPRRMDPDPIRRRRRHHLRLAHPRRKTAPETLLPDPKTDLRSQPPLGHVPRRGEPEDRTRPPPRRAARRSAEGDVSVEDIFTRRRGRETRLILTTSSNTAKPDGIGMLQQARPLNHGVETAQKSVVYRSWPTGADDDRLYRCTRELVH